MIYGLPLGLVMFLVLFAVFARFSKVITKKNFLFYSFSGVMLFVLFFPMFLIAIVDG